MSSLILIEQASAPSTPAAGKCRLYVTNDVPTQLHLVDDSGNIIRELDSKSFAAKGDLVSASAANTPVTLSAGADGLVLAAYSGAASGLKWVSPQLTNQAVAAVTGYAADTFLVGSNITVPAALVRVGTRYHCLFDVTKTGAGTAAAVITFRFGTLGTTGDAAICQFTFNVQTGVIDTGLFEVWIVFRTIGSGTAAVCAGVCTLRHNLAVTGLDTVEPNGFALRTSTSSGFNSTPASSICSVSVNGGASAAWTITIVNAEVDNLNV
jgi:hypothetical protein